MKFNIGDRVEILDYTKFISRIGYEVEFDDIVTNIKNDYLSNPSNSKLGKILKIIYNDDTDPVFANIIRYNYDDRLVYSISKVLAELEMRKILKTGAERKIFYNVQRPVDPEFVESVVVFEKKTCVTGTYQRGWYDYEYNEYAPACLYNQKRHLLLYTNLGWIEAKYCRKI